MIVIEGFTYKNRIVCNLLI